MTRFNIDKKDKKSVETFKNKLKVTAIVVWPHISDEKTALQIFSALISSTDGRIFGPRRRLRKSALSDTYFTVEPQVVELLFTSYNIVKYSDIDHFGSSNPTFDSGAFLIMLKAIFKKQYGYDLETSDNSYFGPSEDLFDHSIQKLEDQATSN